MLPEYSTDVDALPKKPRATYCCVACSLPSRSQSHQIESIDATTTDGTSFMIHCAIAIAEKAHERQNSVCAFGGA